LSRDLVHIAGPPQVLELLQQVRVVLPGPVADVLDQQLREGAVTSALRMAEEAIAAVRPGHAPLLPPAEFAPRASQVAAECERCPELGLCGGSTGGCSWAWCSSHCLGCGVRCPRRTDLQQWREATGRLDFDDLVIRLPEPPEVPPIVPLVDLEELRGWGVARHWPAWALSLGEAHSTRTGAPWRSWADGAAAAVARVAGARLLILSGVAQDQLLAAAWPHLVRGQTVSGFDLVVAPAWSVYDDDPRLEHLFAIRQSLQAAVVLARGQPVIPTLHWHRRFDLDRQLRWARRSHVVAIGIDCSTLPGRSRWLEVRAAMVYVRAALPQVQLHVQGPSTRDRLEDLARLGGVTVYTSRPAALARARRVLDEDLRDRPGPDDRAECLMISIEHLSRSLG
jgi:hypothetical protein